VFHVVVSREVSLALGQLISDRTILVRVLNRLYDHLENHAERYRQNRDADDEDYFDYVHRLYVRGQWQSFRFSVNDVRAQGYLFVEGVSVD